ncbi:helix-turn-helix domain-containing protein [Lonepinella sp. BR2474]|uniref:helix-turn-helix domain-containing protein n=1 Tax=Lonepinella sp. BR2474 TaxID=3434548 RepID=UPI003F6DD8BE
MDVHNTIKAMRKISGLSQEQVAEKLDMSPTGYAKIENGETKLNLDKLQQIANIFNIDMVELIQSPEKALIFSIGDNSNHKQYIGATESIIAENEKLKLILSHKDELLAKQQKEIAMLEDMIALLKANH